MFQWLTGIGLLTLALTPGCTCSARDASCDQTLIALCEVESVCGDGLPVGACLTSNLDFTCTVSVQTSAACVEAINDMLRDECAGFGEATLPCPLLTQAGLYTPCSESLVCAANAPCAEGVSVDGPICSAACDASTPCPAGGGCSSGGFCAPGCSDEFVCADSELCTADGCVACATLCGDECGAVVDGCDCAVCPDCVVDDDCAFGACTDGVCG